MKRLARGLELSGFVGIVAVWPLAVDFRVMLGAAIGGRT
jgi:hypothetical protein